MNRRTFLSLLPSIPLVPRLLEKETMTINIPPRYPATVISYPDFQNSNDMLDAMAYSLNITSEEFILYRAKGWLDKHYIEMIKGLPLR